ncbi:hypothetical protein L6R52_11465 [Myxococcota bacterium]|nr:hypothetical protein [Myxococcota bacterium]
MRRVFDVMVEHYLLLGIQGVPERLGCTTDDLWEYDRDIENVRRTAEHRGHTADLRVGLQFILGRRDFDLKSFYRTSFPWSEEDLREAIEYMYQKLHPDDPIPDGGPRDALLVPCDWPEWNLTMPGSPDDAPKPTAR